MFNLFRKQVTAPRGQVYSLYRELTEAPHCLIAGATGSGKSTVMEGLITTLLYRCPNEAQLVLIDTKRVALSHLRRLPHTIEYADSIEKAEAALVNVSNLMERRFTEMQRQGVREYRGGDVYVVIDEAGDLLTSARKKAIAQLIQHLTMLGRAAKVHVWLGSQVVTREVISTAIKANFDIRIALRTACAQDSRNIVGESGAENFPNPRQAGTAYALIRNGADLGTWKMPRYSDEQQEELIEYWNNPRKYKAA